MTYMNTTFRWRFTIALIAIFGALAYSGGPQPALAAPPPYPTPVHWSSMPIRSTAQAALGMNGGEGAQCIQGFTRCASDDNRLYACVDVVGVWRSDNGGAFWRPCLMNGLHSYGTTAIAVSPTNHDNVLVYVQTQDWETSRLPEIGLYRSTDGGENWTKVVTVANNHNPAGHATISFAANGTRVYFGSRTGGMYRSDDGGATWTAPLGLQGVTIERVSIDPFNNNKVWVATNVGLQVSTDSGATFTVNSFFGAVDGLEVSPDPIVANRVYYIKPGTGLYRSNDAGATWTFITTGVTSFNQTIKQLYQSPIDSNHMTVCSNPVSYYSDDAGATWHQTAIDTSKTYVQQTGWAEEVGVNYSYLNVNNVISGFSCCIYGSTDAGHNYTDSGTGFTGFHHGWGDGAVSFAATDPTRFAFFCYDYNMVISTDNGSTFVNKRLPYKFPTGDGSQWYGGYAGDMSPTWSTLNRVVASSGGYNSHAELTWTDTGSTNATDWHETAGTISNYYFVKFHPTANPLVVYGGNKRSDDGGSNWTVLTYRIMGMAPSNGDIVYARDFLTPSTIFKSTDRGNTWAALPAPPANPTGNEIDVDPTNPNKIWAVTGSDVSVYNGSTWTLISTASWIPVEGHGYADRIAIDPTNANRVIVGLHSCGEGYLFMTEDGGTTWYDITGDAPRLGLNQSLGIQPGTGRIFIGDGIGTYTTNIGVGYPKSGDVTAPSAPTNFTSPTQTASSANLTWTASTDNVGVRAYDIYNGTYLLGTTPSTSYTAMGLVSGNYTFTVKARDNAGNQTASSPLNVTIGSGGGGNTHTGTWSMRGINNGASTWKNAWQAPSGVAANTTYTASFWMKGPGSSAIRILNASWGSEITRGVFTATSAWALYSVTFNTGANTQLTYAIGDGGNVAGTVYIDDCFLGVSGGTNILVNNPGFESGAVNWVIDVPGAYTILQPGGGSPPPVPTGLTATAGNTQVALSWSASTGATSYNVKRSTVSGTGYVTVSSPTTTSFTNTGLTNGTTYYFVVSAVNTGGESANSTQSSATPQPPIPAVPAGLTATAGNTQVSLSWSASSGATSYNVKRSTVSGSGYANIASPTTTSYVNTGLTNGTTYYYVVSAVNGGGESANSTQVSAVPANANTHGGTWALKGVVTGTPSWKNAWQAPGGVTPSTTYTASFWMKGPGSGAIRIFNASWGTEITRGVWTATSSWAQYSFTFNTGANTQLTFAIGDGGSVAGTVYIDDAFMGVLNGTNLLSNPGFEGGAVNWILDSPGPWTIVQNP